MYNPPFPGPGVWEWETCIFQEIKERKKEFMVPAECRLLWRLSHYKIDASCKYINSPAFCSCHSSFESFAVCYTRQSFVSPFFQLPSFFLSHGIYERTSLTLKLIHQTDFDRCLLIHLIWFLLARHQVTHDNSKFMIKINPRCTYSPNNNYRYKSCIDWFLSNSSARCRLKQRNYKNM